LRANIAATWIVSAVVAHTGVFDASFKSAFLEIARHSIERPFGTTILKGVFVG
jgi:formate-nitrite transporter family protein